MRLTVRRFVLAKRGLPRGSLLEEERGDRLKGFSVLPVFLRWVGAGKGRFRFFFSLASTAHEREGGASWNKEGRWVNW